jgi:acetylornithine deacetylase/succinyl-diaminopimelate desuccinylase-like protein
MGSLYRRDALCAAGECILAIERICNEESESGLDIVGTVGVLNIPYMSINKVPGQCWFTLDLRSNSLIARKSVCRRITKAIRHTCKSRQVKLTETITENSEPVSLINNKRTQELQNKVIKVIKELGHSFSCVPSGAGHDAMQIARCGIPVCMLFIPCKGGISHSPLEEAKPEDILKASNILFYVLSRDQSKVGSHGKRT